MATDWRGDSLIVTTDHRGGGWSPRSSPSTDLAADANTTGPRVLLDTNALMMPVECDVRLFDELERVLNATPELLVPSTVITELRSLTEDNGVAGQAATVGLDLAQRARTVTSTAEYADDAIVTIATDPRADVTFVVTNDRELRERLTSRGVHVIGLSGGDTLAVHEPEGSS